MNSQAIVEFVSENVVHYLKYAVVSEMYNDVLSNHEPLVLVLPVVASIIWSAVLCTAG